MTFHQQSLSTILPQTPVNSASCHDTRRPIIAYRFCSRADKQEAFILSQPRIWWDMYHDRPTFSLVEWSEQDVDEYRGGLETKEGVHAVSPRFHLTSDSVHIPSSLRLISSLPSPLEPLHGRLKHSPHFPSRSLCRIPNQRTYDISSRQ